MDIYTRVANLENLVQYLCNLIQSRKEYTDADIDGVRQNVSEMSAEMFPEWTSDSYPYFAGERVLYNGLHYRCIQNHTSQADWTPDAAVSLWVEIANPSIEWPEWKQPTGAHDAYARGDKVSHNGRHWISQLDANVWEPGVDGWSEA